MKSKRTMIFCIYIIKYKIFTFFPLCRKQEDINEILIF